MCFEVCCRSECTEYMAVGKVMRINRDSYTLEAMNGDTTRKRKHWKIMMGCVTILVVGTYLWLFWFQTFMVVFTRHSYRNFPIMSMVPIELSDHSINQGSGSRLSCFDYDFEVPWTDVDTDNVQRKAMVLVPFRSGLQMLVGHGSTHDLIDTIIESTKIKPEEFRAMYPNSVRSDYDLLRLALNATPAQVRILDSKESVSRLSTLLLYKALLVPGDSGIFSIQNPEFKGFQYGDPSKHPNRVTAYLYSSSGIVEFSFSQKGMKPLAISQADINRVIQTMRYPRSTNIASAASAGLHN